MKNLKNYAPSRVSKREQSVVEGAKILDLLAVAMVKKAQIGTNTRKSAKAPDAVVLVDVADPDWIGPVASAWGTVVMGSKGHTELDFEDTNDIDTKGSWVQFALRRKPSASSRSNSKGSFLLLLRLGKPVVIVTSDLSWVPVDFSKLATLRISVAPPTSEMIADIAQDITGDWCVPHPFPDAVAKRLTANDLLLAGTRGDVSAQAFLNRLSDGVVAPVAVQASPTCLEELHGANEAVNWGLGLAKDLADFKTGRISWVDVDKGSEIKFVIISGGITLLSFFVAHLFYIFQHKFYTQYETYYIVLGAMVAISLIGILILSKMFWDLVSSEKSYLNSNYS